MIYTKWQSKKAAYTIDVRNECEYRLEQLKHSFNQRETIFHNMIKNADDERIIRMRQSQLDKLIADFEETHLDDYDIIIDTESNFQIGIFI